MVVTVAGTASFGIAARGYLACGLVIDENARWMRALLCRERERAPVECDAIAYRGACAGLRALAVDGEAPLRDPALDLAARAEPLRCE